MPQNGVGPIRTLFCSMVILFCIRISRQIWQTRNLALFGKLWHLLSHPQTKKFARDFRYVEGESKVLSNPSLFSRCHLVHIFIIDETLVPKKVILIIDYRDANSKYSAYSLMDSLNPVRQNRPSSLSALRVSGT